MSVVSILIRISSDLFHVLIKSQIAKHFASLHNALLCRIRSTQFLRYVIGKEGQKAANLKNLNKIYNNLQRRKNQSFD